MKNLIRNDPDEYGFESIDSNRSNRYLANLEELTESAMNEIEEKSD